MRRSGAVAALVCCLAGPGISQTCLPIDRIETTGVTLLSATDIRTAVAPFEGQCLGIEGLNGALEAVTLAYVEKGYVTARAYLPEQSIADRVLDIAVVEGQLEAIRFNGKPDRRWQHIVFPRLVGKPVQLRKVEQGLDTIRRMPAYEAEMEISAGEAEGGSVLDITATAKKPWTLRVGANNYGSRRDATNPEDETILSTYSGTVDITADHLLGLNETWSFGYSRGTETFPFDTRDGDYATQRIEAGLRLPYGPWEFSARYMQSKYALSSFGTISFIPSDGWVKEARVSLSRLLHRGRDSKTTLSGTLEFRQNEDRVAQIVINASSRTLSSFRLDLTHERSLGGGLLTARLGVEQGLTWFGAEQIAEVSDSQPEAQFTLFDVGVDYTRPWKLKAGVLSYSGQIRAQGALNALHGNYQFNLGGLSSIRGTSRGLMSGANGVLLRNELSFTPAGQDKWPATIQLYGALDVGHIFDQYSTTVAGGAVIGGTMSGGALGLRGQFGKASFDVAWHQVLSVPSGLTRPDGELLASLSFRF